MELEKRREAREKARRRLIRELEKKKRNEAARKIQNMVKVRQAKKFADLIRKKKRRNMRLKKKKVAETFEGLLLVDEEGQLVMAVRLVLFNRSNQKQYFVFTIIPIL